MLKFDFVCPGETFIVDNPGNETPEVQRTVFVKMNSDELANALDIKKESLVTFDKQTRVKFVKIRNIDFSLGV